MLAQNFKTPVDLEMDEKDFIAHVQFLGILERGEIIYQDAWRPKGKGFNMSLAFANCGTIGCIYGWTQNMQGKKIDQIPDSIPAARHELYCPFQTFDDVHERRNAVTLAQAAIALRNYLTSGEPRWDEALAA